MSPAALEKPAHQAHTFSAPESFGLFMEALRDLQIYADDSAQSVPDAAKLEEHLDSALEALTRCHQEFPDDLLPRYYLGISLTMKNQHLYAKSLLQQIAGATRNQSSLPPAGPSQSIVRALLASRPWPLLDRAISLFEQVIRYGYADLAQAAQFNLAHVYAKRDGEGDLQQSLDLLSSIPASRRPSPPLPMQLRLRVFLQGKLREKREAQARAYRESIARSFQASTLTAAVQARLALQSGSEAEYRSCAQELEAIRRDVERTEELNPEAKHDLLADSWTKSGFILFLHAKQTGREDRELATAEVCLNQALHYKPFWIPAQTYLAMVYVGQGRLDQATQELLSVAGSSSTPPPTEQTKNTN
jgi:hypothetical protein